MCDSRYWREVRPEGIPSSLSVPAEFREGIPRDARILDLGCGNGGEIERWLEHGFRNVFGADLNAPAVRAASRRVERFGMPLLAAADAGALPFLDESFDCIVTQAFWTTIVREADRAKIIRDIRRVLKPGGIWRIVDFAQNWELPAYRERYEEGLRAGLERGAFPVTDPETGETLYLARHFTEDEFRSLLLEQSFTIESFETGRVRTRTGNEIAGFSIVARRPG